MCTPASADGTTALHWAVYNDDADLVQRLIKAGADVSATNDYGATPLRTAATVADPAVIKALLKAGANANEPNAEGETPLMVVARTGNVEAAKLLLSHGAKVNAKEQWGGQTAADVGGCAEAAGDGEAADFPRRQCQRAWRRA